MNRYWIRKSTSITGLHLSTESKQALRKTCLMQGSLNSTLTGLQNQSGLKGTDCSSILVFTLFMKDTSSKLKEEGLSCPNHSGSGLQWGCQSMNRTKMKKPLNFMKQFQK